jgi:hypothetical protein
MTRLNAIFAADVAQLVGVVSIAACRDRVTGESHHHRR